MPVQAWMWWQQLMLVMLGGALGAAARFWLGGVLLRRVRVSIRRTGEGGGGGAGGRCRCCINDA